VRNAFGDPPASIRAAGADDVPAMAASRLGDPAAGPADGRMAAYFQGRHHPREALAPRVGYVAELGDDVVGYIAGHLTRRFGCDGEIQYLYVTPDHRRLGIARQLVRRLAGWFLEHGASHVCVDVDPDSPAARALYLDLGAADLQPPWMEWRDIRDLTDARRR
jgi:GNAT superfamily N-acetyltransferase